MGKLSKKLAITGLIFLIIGKILLTIFFKSEIKLPKNWFVVGLGAIYCFKMYKDESSSLIFLPPLFLISFVYLVDVSTILFGSFFPSEIMANVYIIVLIIFVINMILSPLLKRNQLSILFTLLGLMLFLSFYNTISFFSKKVDIVIMMGLICLYLGLTLMYCSALAYRKEYE